MAVTEATFQEWEAKLEGSNFFGGDDPSEEDNNNLKALDGSEPPATFPNVFGWFLVVKMFTEEVRSTWTAPKGKGGKKDKKGKKEEKKEEVKKEEDDDEDDEFDDMFGEDEDDAAAKEEIAKKAKEDKEKKKKAAPVAKSIILFEVKPWEAEQDLDALAAKILGIEMDGLLWKTEFKKEPIGYGIFKLIMGCTVEDDKVGVDDLLEKIGGDFEDEVQSTDILAFNKV
ncbi:unnamed protein product [Moneuplotes crassus]|uniref:Translation elongation factor EF1B beta/delta subunit guanine nucleotide exchange domain-containing protein n=1 Tax=Euplotes crassus TaxID=5936 RepID=A0AAD1XVK2_EUPCR|nr:unnamed protein product [Moneuplotes crassus]